MTTTTVSTSSNHKSSRTNSTATAYTDQLASLQKSKKYQSLAAWNQAVKLLADNKSPEIPPPAFLDLQNFLGKSDADLQADVARCQRIATFNADQSRLAKLLEDQQDAESDLAEAETELAKIAAPLEQRCLYLQSLAASLSNQALRIRGRSRPASDLIPDEYLSQVPTDKLILASRASTRAAAFQSAAQEKINSLSSLQVSRADEPSRLHDLARAKAALTVWQRVRDTVAGHVAAINAGRARLDAAVCPETGLFNPQSEPESYWVHIPADAFVIPSTENVSLLVNVELEETAGA